MSNRPTAIILVGMPASGKSTMRAKLKSVMGKENRVFVYSLDDIIEAEAKEIGKTYHDTFMEVVSTAETIMTQGMYREIDDGTDIIVDTTNLTREIRAKRISVLGNTHSVKCICFVPPRNDAEMQVLLKRLRGRTDKVIPTERLVEMADSYQKPGDDEGFSEIAYFDINGNIIAKPLERPHESPYI